MCKNSKRKGKKLIEDFVLMDDLFFRFVADYNIPLIELMLNIIIEKKVKVIHMMPQKDEANLKYRSVVFDVLAKDIYGVLYNIEMQHGAEGAHAKRARYHSSMLDYNHTKKGKKDFSVLPETFVIMICDIDILSGHKAIYHVDRFVKETNKAFGDEQHIIYINSSYHDKNDKSDLALLIHDMICTDYNNMYYNVIRESVKRAKNPEGVIYQKMSKVLDEQYNYGVKVGEKEGLKSGVQKGRKEHAKEVAMRLLAKKQYSYEEVAEISGYPKDSISLLVQETEYHYTTKK